MDEAAKKTVLRLFPYGLYAVTAMDGAVASGMTANWLTQVSFEPPLVAVAMESDARTLQLVRAGGHFLEHADLRPRVHLRVAQDGAELGDVANGGGEVHELLVDALEPAVFLGRFEQRLRVGAVDRAHRPPTGR